MPKGGSDTEKEASKAKQRVLVAADDGMVVKRTALQLGDWSHNQALRALSNCLVGILHGCLRYLVTYDEHTACAHRAENLNSEIIAAA